MVPRENKNNAYAKIWGDKKRVLWYFPNWPIERLFFLQKSRADRFCLKKYEFRLHKIVLHRYYSEVLKIKEAYRFVSVLCKYI